MEPGGFQVLALRLLYENNIVGVKMKAELKWNEGMSFNGLIEGHQVLMDAKSPIGKGSGPTPKDLVALGLAGCTAMDVAALLKKAKQIPTLFKVDVEIEASKSGHPAVFEKAQLVYKANGNIEKDTFLESVRLSQTKFCGVSAMLSKAFPIEYKVILNDVEIGSGRAAF